MGMQSTTSCWCICACASSREWWAPTNLRAAGLGPWGVVLHRDGRACALLATAAMPLAARAGRRLRADRCCAALCCAVPAVPGCAVPGATHLCMYTLGSSPAKQTRSRGTHCGVWKRTPMAAAWAAGVGGAAAPPPAELRAAGGGGSAQGSTRHLQPAIQRAVKGHACHHATCECRAVAMARPRPHPRLRCCVRLECPACATRTRTCAAATQDGAAHLFDSASYATTAHGSQQQLLPSSVNSTTWAGVLGRPAGQCRDPAGARPAAGGRRLPRQHRLLLQRGRRSSRSAGSGRR